MLLIQKKIKKVSETRTKMGWMIRAKRKVRGKGSCKERRAGQNRRGCRGSMMEFAQNCCTATLWPPDASPYCRVSTFLQTSQPHTPPAPPFRRKKEDLVRKGTTLTVKPTSTRDKLQNPSPIEGTALQFNGRRRA
jgi:hypothetical protein